MAVFNHFRRLKRLIFDSEVDMGKKTELTLIADFSPSPWCCLQPCYILLNKFTDIKRHHGYENLRASTNQPQIRSKHGLRRTVSLSESAHAHQVLVDTNCAGAPTINLANFGCSDFILPLRLPCNDIDCSRRYYKAVSSRTTLTFHANSLQNF